MSLSFPIGVSLIPAAIAVAILAIGLVLWRKQVKGAAAVVLAIGAGVGVVFGPMLFADRVHVGPSGIQQSTGFWFAPTEKGFDFEGLDRVLITSGRDMQGREIEMWVAEYASGDTVTIDPGDLWESNGERIVAYMEQAGIRVDRSH